MGQIRTISILVPLNPHFSTSDQRCFYERSRFCFATDHPATKYIWDRCLGFVLGSGIPSLGFDQSFPCLAAALCSVIFGVEFQIFANHTDNALAGRTESASFIGSSICHHALYDMHFDHKHKAKCML